MMLREPGAFLTARDPLGRPVAVEEEAAEDMNDTSDIEDK